MRCLERLLDRMADWVFSKITESYNDTNEGKR